MKRKLAIWMPAGIGGGYFSQGIPVVAQAVNRLSNDYEVTVFSLHSPNSGYSSEKFRMISINPIVKLVPLRWLGLTFLFLKYHIKNRFQVLYAFWGFPTGFIVTVLGKLFGIASIVHLQGGDVVAMHEINYGTLRNPLYKRLARWTYRNARELIVLTEFQSRFLADLNIKRHMNIIPFGVELSHFPKKEWSFTNQRELRCLHIGNFSPVKDQLMLLKTIASLGKRMPVTLKIIGENSCNGVLKKYCEELAISDRVELFEPISNVELKEFYSWADVFILTSLYEGQGVVIAEAAASGNLLTGTSVGLLNDLGETFAIVSSPGDFEDLSRKIETTVKDSNDACQRIDRAYRWTTDHDINWTVLKLKEVIDRVK